MQQTCQVHFGPGLLAPVPFRCRTIQDWCEQNGLVFVRWFQPPSGLWRLQWLQCMHDLCVKFPQTSIGLIPALGAVCIALFHCPGGSSKGMEKPQLPMG